MKPIVALMITGLLASSAVMAQDSNSKMGTPAPAAPAATAPSAGTANGDQPAKKSAHHRKKKSHKMAKAEGGDTKSGMKSSTESTKPEGASSEMKK
jgi:hypothetical protein